MIINEKHKISLRLKDLHNKILFKAFKTIQPIYRVVCKSDVAYIYCRHPVITPFLINLKIHLNVTIHFLEPGSDFSAYRKVIVPNGMWHDIKPTADQIPPEKKVYCEVGFFPQNKNVYLDDKGVHGYSSVRDTQITKLTQEQRHELEVFRSYYTGKNFIKFGWDTVDNGITVSTSALPAYLSPYLFVPLQLEADTAFDLSPFASNQEMIDKIQAALPRHRIIFKVHPWDENATYTVAIHNILLPQTNTDLRELLLQADAVISCNSTVMLEALLYGTKCASVGIGFSTNHHVSLECHQDIAKLTEIDNWQPDLDRVDEFLYYLFRKQVNVKFWKSKEERDKLRFWLQLYEIIE